MWHNTGSCNQTKQHTDMNVKNASLQVRINEKTKREAQKVLSDIGLDISSGVNIFLTQVVRTKSIPFEIRTENGFTPEYEESILSEQKSRKRKVYDSFSEAHARFFKK